jgi:hypothetical protein
MKTLSKTALLIAGTATLIAAAPASARHDDWGRGGWGHRDRIDAGDVIAGALIIGGIAAIASAGSNRNSGYGYGGNYGYHDSYRGDRRDDDNGYYENGYDSRRAVDQCVRAAQREASRYGWARVTDVGNIYRIRGGYEVRGRLVVETRGRGYDRGYYYDRYNNDYDKGRFTCTTRYGGIEDLRVSGLRGGW